MKVTSTGVERLDVVQLSHRKLAEITGEANRITRPSVLLFKLNKCSHLNKLMLHEQNTLYCTDLLFSVLSLRLSGKSPDMFLKSKEAILTGVPLSVLSSTSLGILMLTYSASMGDILSSVSFTNTSSTWKTTYTQ